MKEFVFETYKEMTNFLEDSNDIDDIIIESAKKLVDDKNLELNIIKLRCIEINKYADIKFTYDNIVDALHKVMLRKTKIEDYESCYDIKILLDKVLNKDKNEIYS